MLGFLHYGGTGGEIVKQFYKNIVVSIKGNNYIKINKNSLKINTKEYNVSINNKNSISITQDKTNLNLKLKI